MWALEMTGAILGFVGFHLGLAEVLRRNRSREG